MPHKAMLSLIPRLAKVRWNPNSAGGPPALRLIPDLVRIIIVVVQVVIIVIIVVAIPSFTSNVVLTFWLDPKEARSFALIVNVVAHPCLERSLSQ
jgi:hypothetical protein